jgi:hypothetical protein
LIGFPYYYRAHWGYMLAGGLVWLVGTLSFYTVPRVHRPEGFAVPLNPILPCLGTLANIFLIGESAVETAELLPGRTCLAYTCSVPGSMVVTIAVWPAYKGFPDAVP